MGESVGSQDQLAASLEGFNKISLKKITNFKFKNIKKTDRVKKLEDNLILIYSGIQRTAQYIASGYVKKLTSSKKLY